MEVDFKSLLRWTAIFSVLTTTAVVYQNCGQPVNFKALPESSSHFIQNIDQVCASGAVDPNDIVFPPFQPLVPPVLPANCANGFELNNLQARTHTIYSNTPAGSRAITLAMDVATYTAPDDILITATDSAGTQTVLVHTCRMRTWDASDPTDGTYRPPDETIRQFRINLPAGTRALTFDYSQAHTPTYVRLLGLCDFNIQPPVPSVGLQWRPFP